MQSGCVCLRKTYRRQHHPMIQPHAHTCICRVGDASLRFLRPPDLITTEQQPAKAKINKNRPLNLKGRFTIRPVVKLYILQTLNLTPSRLSRLRFQSNPPPKPPGVFIGFAASTRWPGTKNRNRIRAARAAHGADGLGFANRRCDFAVAFRFTKGDFLHCAPDAFLECRSDHVQRRKFFRFITNENFLEGNGSLAMPAKDFILWETM